MDTHYFSASQAITVLLTIVYLADQIKQNTKAVKAAIQQAISDATSEVWRNACIGIDRPVNFYESSEKERRSKAEQSYYIGWVMQTFRRQKNIFLNRRLGSIDDDFVDIDSRIAAQFKPAQSRNQNAWLNGEPNNFLITAFRNYVDILIRAKFLLVKK